MDLKMSQELRGRILSLVLILGGLAPSVALATVGFAETHSRLAYNDLAELDWVHPGDGCNVGKTCFFLEKKGKPSGWFRDLYGSMRRVSVPPGTGVSLVLGEWSAGGWFVYDLRDESYRTKSASYEEALALWKSAGFPEPVLADAPKLSRYFRETWASRLEGLTMLALLFSPMIVMSLPFVLLLLIWSLLTFRRTKSKSFLALAALLLVPAVLGLFLLLRILAVLPKAR